MLTRVLVPAPRRVLRGTWCSSPPGCRPIQQGRRDPPQTDSYGVASVRGQTPQEQTYRHLSHEPRTRVMALTVRAWPSHYAQPRSRPHPALTSSSPLCCAPCHCPSRSAHSTSGRHHQSLRGHQTPRPGPPARRDTARAPAEVLGVRSERGSRARARGEAAGPRMWSTGMGWRSSKRGRSTSRGGPWWGVRGGMR